MILITVKYLLGLSESIGRKEERVTLAQGATVGELLEELFDRYGPDFRREVFDNVAGRVHSYVLILVNGLALTQLREGLDTALDTGDVVILTRPISGG
jgi:MoaD family protein